MERRLADFCYINEDKFKEFFDKYTKLEYIGFKSYFSEPQDQFPAIIYDVEVLYTDEYSESHIHNVHFEIVDDGKDRRWVYRFDSNLHANNSDNDCNKYGIRYDYDGCLSELHFKWFLNEDKRINSRRIKYLKNVDKIVELEMKSRDLQKAINILEEFGEVSINELKNRVELINDKINILKEV